MLDSGIRPADYDAKFYESESGVYGVSSRALVGWARERFRPQSVIDVGCGVGGFLREFIEQGVPDVLGIEGEWLPPARLQVPADRVQLHDLTTPLRLGRVFDLALCLEVGEHLPASAADTLVEGLVHLAPIIVFSAAIPFQGGTHHVNERWPNYWARKFWTRGFAAYDCLRGRLSTVPGILPWYAQNAVIYARAADAATDPRRAALASSRVRRVPFRYYSTRHPGFARLLNTLPTGARECTYLAAAAPISYRDKRRARRARS